MESCEPRDEREWEEFSEAIDPPCTVSVFCEITGEEEIVQFCVCVFVCVQYQ